MEKMFWAYVMASDSGTLYVGSTGNLTQRVRQHKHNVVKGFSQKYSCHKLVYFEECGSMINALAREKQLKNWSRDKKETLIRKMNPHWNDLMK